MASEIKGLKDELGQINKIKNELKQLDKLKEPEKAAQKEQELLAKEKTYEKNKEIKLEDIKQYNQEAGKAQNWGQISNQFGQGVTGFVNSMFGAEEKKTEAEGKEFEAKAQFDQSEADKAKDVQQAFEDTIKQLIAFLKDMQDSKANQMAALTKV
jgi:hypothetical protein